MPERSQDGVEGFIPELVRKAVERSVQTLLQSEEGMRSVVSALMPREVLSNVVQQLDGAKRDAVLSNAPKSADGFFVVPKVVD